MNISKQGFFQVVVGGDCVWVAFLLHVWEVALSDLGQEIGFQIVFMSARRSAPRPFLCWPGDRLSSVLSDVGQELGF
jgi:hypothetical protein